MVVVVEEEEDQEEVDVEASVAARVKVVVGEVNMLAKAAVAVERAPIGAPCRPAAR